jgi:manganese transport protein
MIRTRPIPRRPPSLPEVHGSVTTTHPSIWRRMFAFAGPAYLVSVGYMDPGNWATDLEGGARFGYQLLWVLVMSNAMAILLQTLSARLGIVSGRDLAQACADTYPRFVSYPLWFLCEIAIAACDMAELLGAAIALNLLFGIPLLWGVFITAVDTLLLLGLSRFGIRLIEGIVLSMVTVITGCMFVEIWLAKPAAGEVLSGLKPQLTSESLYVAIAMLGATVMPHNLYLHSALVQTRRIGRTTEDKRRACRYNVVDSAVALNGALLVNAAILILAATVFYKNGVVVTEIQQAHELLARLLGTTLASIAFGVALLLSGQSSTMTGTMAGQIVMEGFLHIRMRPWLRRLITRLVAITPAAIAISVTGEEAVLPLLILSQVILSMQLPFAVIPLIHFTSDRQRMGVFANPGWVRALAWVAAGIIVTLNLQLALQTVAGWLAAAGQWRWLVELLVVGFGTALAGLLAWVTFLPVPRRGGRDQPGIRRTVRDGGSGGGAAIPGRDRPSPARAGGGRAGRALPLAGPTPRDRAFCPPDAPGPGGHGSARPQVVSGPGVRGHDRCRAACTRGSGPDRPRGPAGLRRAGEATWDTPGA